MFLQIGKLLAKAYLLLLTVAAGGLVGANVLAFVPAIGEFAGSPRWAHEPGFVRSWIDAGWIAGAALFFAGAVGPTSRSMREAVRAMRRPATAGRSSGPERNRSGSRGFSATVGSRRCGIPGSMGIGGLVGGFLGLSLGGSLLLLWFSIAYSPLAPDGWVSTISVEAIGDETARARPRERAMTTDHPVALYAFGGPIVLGAAGGAVVCGVGASIERWKRAAGNVTA